MPEKVEKKEVAKEPVRESSSVSDSNLMAAIAEFFGLGVVIPVLLYLIKKEDSFVRFHSLQAALLGIVFWVLFGGLWVLSFVLAIVTTPLGGIGGFAYCLIFPLMGAFVIAALFLAWKAYQGERYALPLIGSFAEKHS